MPKQLFYSWLWPDHAIGKKESRKLREEHNAVLNAYNDSVVIDAPKHPEEQPDLRFRMFTAVYVCPGTKRGSRITITDLRHNTRKTLNYDDGKGRTFEQATAYLRSIGITVDAMGLADKDCDCCLLSRDKSTPLK